MLDDSSNYEGGSESEADVNADVSDSEMDVKPTPRKRKPTRQQTSTTLDDSRKRKRNAPGQGRNKVARMGQNKEAQQKLRDKKKRATENVSAFVVVIVLSKSQNAQGSPDAVVHIVHPTTLS